MEHPTNNNEKNDGLANRLNQECYCITLDRKALNTSLQDQLVETRNNPIGANELNKLFQSNTRVRSQNRDRGDVERIVRAIESAAELPLYQEQVLSWAPEIAAFDPGPIGALMGYDFHWAAMDLSSSRSILMPVAHFWMCCSLAHKNAVAIPQSKALATNQMAR